MTKLRVIHYLNQFFAGLGGEEKANQPPLLLEGPKGPGNMIHNLYPDLLITHTLVCGDNHMAEQGAAPLHQIIDLLRPVLEGEDSGAPYVLLAGPAFNAGRYGLACGAVCKAVAAEFSLPVITAMYPENPAVIEYRKDIVIGEASENVMGMG
ncbi:MAG: glycine/betaine/sarcosine/D-proline family reductase selenoprotein B, partial [Desulfobulbaceae bacterium]|nr:glycine/betaine/sarcosine/D-proline family reductase selenoprotein B [Desulfobulbaceae bacterium]